MLKFVAVIIDIMKKHLSLFIIAVIALCGSLTMSAQGTSPRSAGYKGSVTLTDQYFVIVGFETSHGYMFNEHHYLGAGVGGFFIPTDNLPRFGQVFVDYRAYLSDKPSTMVLGVKAGFCHAFKTNDGNHHGYSFMNAATLEPSLGWIWGGKKGNGFGISLGGQVLAHKDDVSVLPKLNFFYEF